MLKVVLNNTSRGFKSRFSLCLRAAAPITITRSGRCFTSISSDPKAQEKGHTDVAVAVASDNDPSIDNFPYGRVHYPVMQDKVIAMIDPKPGGWYCDATFGEGGYTKALLDCCDCNVVAIDQDQAAIEKCELLASMEMYKGRLFPLQGQFSNMGKMISNFRHENRASSPSPLVFDGVVFDLGLCSSQISSTQRGFSYLKEGPLDMRMSLEDPKAQASRTAINSRRTIPASVVVNTFPTSKIKEIIEVYGEERYSKQISEAIQKARSIKHIGTTTELATIIEEALPLKHIRSSKRSNKHGGDGGGPGISHISRVFQALRMYVNDELNELQKGLQVACHDLLKPGGKVVVVSFHSLEDRIVKQFFKNNKPTLEVLTKKALIPGENEVSNNRPSRSAKLRAALKKL